MTLIDISKSDLIVLALWSLPGIGIKGIEALTAQVGDLSEVASEKNNRWITSIDFNPALKELILEQPPLRDVGGKVVRICEREGIRIAFRHGEGYPPLLSALADSPPVIFYRGPGAEVSSLRRCVALVGTRKPDHAFIFQAKRFAASLASQFCIVSGMAEGIDRICHYAALEQGQETWAFLACGLDQLDASHRRIWPTFESQKGTFFSEFPPGVRSNPQLFPRRNRLISGSSEAVVILRAGAESGALHTAHYAHKQQRPVFALPGDLSNPVGAGCNALIQSGQARMCLGADEVAHFLNARISMMPPQASADLKVSLSELGADAVSVWKVLSDVPIEFDQVLEQSGLESGALSSALCELDLGGWVRQLPGRRYMKSVG